MKIFAYPLRMMRSAMYGVYLIYLMSIYKFNQYLTSIVFMRQKWFEIVLLYWLTWIIYTLKSENILISDGNRPFLSSLSQFFLRRDWPHILSSNYIMLKKWNHFCMHTDIVSRQRNWVLQFTTDATYNRWTIISNCRL